MKESLFEAIAKIDPKFIEEAASLPPAQTRRFPRAAFAGIAAAALAAAILPTALLISSHGSSVADDTPPSYVTPGEEPGKEPGGDPSGSGDPVDPGGDTDISDGPGEGAQTGAPMSLGETRTLPSGTEIEYRSKTDHSITIYIKKADDAPVYVRLTGRSGTDSYYASTDPRYSANGMRVENGITITVNGEKGDFPSAAGQYEIVIDFAPLRTLCSSLDDLYTSLGAFFL